MTNFYSNLTPPIFEIDYDEFSLQFGLELRGFDVTEKSHFLNYLNYLNFLKYMIFS